MVYVAQDGSGDFDNLQAAIDSIPEDSSSESVIYIKRGIYKQKVEIRKSNITLIGEDASETVITYDDAASSMLLSGEKMRTFNSYSIYISGDNVTARNITFENSAGEGSVVGQAVAVYAEGDRMRFFDCRFLGCQDTLFTAPLPPKPIEGTTFGGPGEGKPRRNVRQYYENCFIKGDVDFIFGSATAVFNKCEVYSRNINQKINGYITAASTPEEVAFGYVFFDCRLTGDAPPASVYLGRPWRDYAKTLFINCYMGEHIIPEGWHNWNKQFAAENYIDYCEYKSYGPGAGQKDRVVWSKNLTENEAGKYNIINILSGNDNWDPIGKNND